MTELGYPEMDVVSFAGLAVPAATSDDRAATLTNALQLSLGDERIADKADLGYAKVLPLKPVELKQRLAEAYKTALQIAEANKIRSD